MSTIIEDNPVRGSVRRIVMGCLWTAAAWTHRKSASRHFHSLSSFPILIVIPDHSRLSPTLSSFPHLLVIPAKAGIQRFTSDAHLLGILPNPAEGNGTPSACDSLCMHM